MPGYKGTITVHGSRSVALECEEGDAAYAESVCATEELKFYKDNVDSTDMTSLKKPTTKHDCLLKFKSTDDTKLVDFVPGDSSKQFSISANLDPKSESALIEVCYLLSMRWFSLEEARVMQQSSVSISLSF